MIKPMRERLPLRIEGDEDCGRVRDNKGRDVWTWGFMPSSYSEITPGYADSLVLVELINSTMPKDVRCTCPCHTMPGPMIHVRPCCDLANDYD
jgi:hypothetical protein